MVNYLTMYLEKLQEKLIPIYDLLKKHTPFIWSEECQNAFDTIKQMLVSPAILAMPNKYGHFTMSSDTSKKATGCALYQEQQSEDKLVGYHSKRLIDAASRYSISELELLGLSINISAYKHYLRNTDFSVEVDHSSLVNIMHSKKEPPTLRIKKLLEILSQYCFTIRYRKGKEMYVSDYLSRHPICSEESPHEVIPITFYIADILQTSQRMHQKHKKTEIKITENELKSILQLPLDYKFKKRSQIINDLKITTRSGAKKDDQVPPPIWPLKGDHRKPEYQGTPQDKPNIPPIPLPVPDQIQPDPDDLPIDLPLPEPPQPNILPQPINLPPQINQPPPYVPPNKAPILPQQLPRPPDPPQQPLPFVPPKVLQDQPNNQQQDFPYIDMTKQHPIDVKLQGFVPPYNDNVNEQTNIRLPDDSMYDQKHQLFDQIKNENILRKHLPKQTELDKYLNKLKRKVINNYEVPLSTKQLIPNQKNSPFFKDIYKYIQTGRIPTYLTGKARTNFEKDAQNYVVIEEVLFRLPLASYDNEEPELLLCIPEKNIPHILYYYHDSLLAGHQGVTRMYLTLRQKYFIPYLFDAIRNYVLSCEKCQKTRLKNKGKSSHHERIPFDFRPMTTLSCDIKYMPTSSNQYKYILFATCDVTGYVVATPLINQTSEHVAEALLNRVVWQFGPPKTIIFDQGANFSSEVMTYIYESLHMRPLVVSPGNHGSLKTERYIRTISEMITKVISEKGSKWPLFLNACCYAHNTFVSPTTGYSPFELVYLHKPVDLIDLRFNPFSGRTRDATSYVELMKQRFQTIKEIVTQKKLLQQREQTINQERQYENEKDFAVGDLVFLYAPTLSGLHTSSRKFTQDWIGPLQIQAVLDKTHYMLADWKGHLLPFFGSVHKNRLKHCYINLGKMIGNKIATVNNTKDLIETWSKLYPDN